MEILPQDYINAIRLAALRERVLQTALKSNAPAGQASEIGLGERTRKQLGVIASALALPGACPGEEKVQQSEGRTIVSREDYVAIAARLVAVYIAMNTVQQIPQAVPLLQNEPDRVCQSNCVTAVDVMC